MKNQEIELAAKLSEIVLRNSANVITDSIKRVKAKKNDKETIKQLEEIINNLLDDKIELIRISRTYEEEVVTQKISKEDISYITNELLPVLEKVLKKSSDIEDSNLDEINEIIEILKPILSVETFTILQLIGFNFKEGIGKPLTQLLKDLILSKKHSNQKENIEYQELEYKKLITQQNIEYYKMINNETSYERFKELQQSNL